MKQYFEGSAQAINFAQQESKRLNKKFHVYILRDSGVRYAVCDSIGAQDMPGKRLETYGEDAPIRTFTPPPPIIEVKPEPIPEPVVEVVAEEPEASEPEQGTPVVEKPKRTRKPKADE